MPTTVKNVGPQAGGNGIDTTQPYHNHIRYITADKFEVVIGPNMTRGFADQTAAFIGLAATSTASVGFVRTRKTGTQDRDPGSGVYLET